MESWQANAKLNDTSKLWYILVNLLFFFPLILVIRYTPALLLPLLLFGLLRIDKFREMMSGVNVLNRINLVRILKILALVLTVAWCIAGLVDYTVLPLVLGSALAYLLFCRLVNTLKVAESEVPRLENADDQNGCDK